MVEHKKHSYKVIKEYDEELKRKINELPLKGYFANVYAAIQVNAIDTNVCPTANLIVLTNIDTIATSL